MPYSNVARNIWTLYNFNSVSFIVGATYYQNFASVSSYMGWTNKPLCPTDPSYPTCKQHQLHTKNRASHCRCFWLIAIFYFNYFSRPLLCTYQNLILQISDEKDLFKNLIWNEIRIQRVWTPIVSIDFFNDEPDNLVI